MRFTNIVAVANLLAFAGSAAADVSGVPSGEYELDDHHGYISFTYSHLGFSTPHVGFSDFNVELDLDNGSPENSSVNVVINTASIDSRVDEFDGHLRGADFFNTEQFPEATFTSSAIKATGESTYDVLGDLTIKGVTKPVTLAVNINRAAMHPMRNVPTVGLSGETTINRSEFDLGRFVPNVGDEVTISVTAELLKKAE